MSENPVLLILAWAAETDPVNKDHLWTDQFSILPFVVFIDKDIDILGCQCPSILSLNVSLTLILLVFQGEIEFRESESFKVLLNISAPSIQDAYAVNSELVEHDGRLLLQVVSWIFFNTCIREFSFIVSHKIKRFLREIEMSHNMTKRVFGSFRPGARHKPTCVATEAS